MRWPSVRRVGEEVRHARQQTFAVHFHLVTVEAAFDGPLPVAIAVERRQGQQGQVTAAELLAYCPGQAPAVHLRHLDVGDDQVEWLPRQLAQTQRSVDGRDDLVTLLL